MQTAARQAGKWRWRCWRAGRQHCCQQVVQAIKSRNTSECDPKCAVQGRESAQSLQKDRGDSLGARVLFRAVSFLAAFFIAFLAPEGCATQTTG